MLNNGFRRATSADLDEDDVGKSFFERGGDLDDDSVDKSYFSRAGDLDTDDIGKTYFSRPTDLDGDNLEEIYFSRAGDLEPSKKNSNSFVFESDTMGSAKSSDEINKWLKTIVSGKKMYTPGFDKVPYSSGIILVSLEELKQMVDNGDNIISAEYFENANLVSVEFESFNLNNSRRSR